MPSRNEDVRNGRKGKLASPTSTSSVLESIQRFWQRSYAGDYLGLAIIVILYVPLKVFGEPYHQMFRLSDPRIQHPHAEVERVGVCTSRAHPPIQRYLAGQGLRIPNSDMLLLYTVPLPLLLLTLWTLIPAQNRHKLHPSLLGLAISMLLTTFLTDIIKDGVGRPRPDLLARCKPALDTQPEDLVTVDVCTETRHHLLHDGFRSFPSGHSSLAWASLGWTALFMGSQLHVLRPRANLATVVLCLVPPVGAALIAISRLEDYRHDVGDVIVGSVLGMGIAYMNWRRYWPSLRSRDCDEPHSLPGSRRGSPDGGFTRVRDEEEGLGNGHERFSIGDDEGGYDREGER